MRPREDRDSFELRPQGLDHGHDYPRRASLELKPTDRGRHAWTVLIAGVVFEALFWGFPMSFGVFQNYYSNIPEFQKDSDNIPLVGTLAQALYYLGAPISAILTKKFPKRQRLQIWIGWPFCVLGLLAASFTSMVNEWFVARKGMAFGLISASSGVTGAGMPFIIEALLNKYGHKTTLRACAVGLAILTAPLIPLFKGRLPPSETATLARSDWAFVKRPLFWIYGLAILIQGMGFFFPSVFLPSYAASLDLPSVQGALLLAIMSVAQVAGQFAFGYLSDKTLPVSILATSCCVMAAAAALIFWGLAKSLVFLILFSLLYGFFGFGFGTMRVAMGRAVSDDPLTIFATYAIFVFLQGVGNVLVSPISAALIGGNAVRERFAVGRFDGVVILTGVSSVLAAVVIGGWHGYHFLLK
ncbi:MFS general substrate transporter [Aspergillus keveii]|uniref:MFS general substrate transporter n=1 Tax=Aspergillus keveii TaxID=714993 RepID=A0ABR4GHD9_9EURO